MEGLQADNEQVIDGSENAPATAVIKAENATTEKMEVKGIKASPEGAEIFMRGFDKTLWDANPFQYDSEKGAITFDSNKVEAAKNLATCGELELIDATSFLIDSGVTSINVVNWGDALPTKSGESLENQKRAAETATEAGASGLAKAIIYIARDSQVKIGEKPINPNYNERGDLISSDGFQDITENISPDELSIAGLHELAHPFLRATDIKLTNSQHKRKVEDFENTMRSIYQTATKQESVRVKGYGKVKYQVPIYIGGKASPH